MTIRSFQPRSFVGIFSVGFKEDIDPFIRTL